MLAEISAENLAFGIGLVVGGGIAVTVFVALLLKINRKKE